ncbi:MAG: alpha-L-rhamnosidase, partial [Bacteroidia bacterium]|nr:alpha-L-rhamnosidase [Bacteroidia bacterium]
QDPGMNSFNHYAYGAIGDWMYRVSAGIEIGKPGYKHIIIQPHPTKRLEYSKASFESSYGTITSGWERKDNRIIVTVRIPANTTATVKLPVKEASLVTEKGKSISENPLFTGLKAENNQVLFEAGSGNYTFEFSE